MKYERFPKISGTCFGMGGSELHSVLRQFTFDSGGRKVQIASSPTAYREPLGRIYDLTAYEYLRECPFLSETEGAHRPQDKIEPR